MPKNNKRMNFKSNTSNQLRLRNEEDGEQYAEVEGAEGEGRFTVKILNGPSEKARLKGSMRKGRGFVKVKKGDMVLVQIDPTTTGKDKYYIIHKYSEQERKQLETYGELKSVIEEKKSNWGFEGDDEIIEKKEEEVDEDFINKL